MAKNATGQRKAAAGEQTRLLDLKKVDRKGSRFLDVTAAPKSYDEAEHTVEIVMTTGAAVERWYGVEALSMEQAAVCIKRLASSGNSFPRQP